MLREYCSRVSANRILDQQEIRLVLLAIAFLSCLATACAAQQPSAASIGPLQADVAAQLSSERVRLASALSEDRRDALARLAGMRTTEAARVATIALTDRVSVVRASAVAAVVWLPKGEAVAVLLPVLHDKSEFVRGEAAYALGRIGSRAATGDLIRILTDDKRSNVRAAAAVALGQIADPAALAPLQAAVLLTQLRSKPTKVIVGKRAKGGGEPNEFVRRMEVRALGKLGMVAAVPALVAVVVNNFEVDDVRREAAAALSVLGTGEADAALRSLLTASDPYLAGIAADALKSHSAR